MIANWKINELIPTMIDIFNKSEQYSNSKTRYRNSNHNEDVIYLRHKHNGEITNYNWVMNPNTFEIITLKLVEINEILTL